MKSSMLGKSVAGKGAGKWRLLSFHSPSGAVSDSLTKAVCRLVLCPLLVGGPPVLDPGILSAVARHMDPVRSGLQAGSKQLSEPCPHQEQEPPGAP